MLPWVVNYPERAICYLFWYTQWGGGLYRQGTGTCWIHQRMMICAIGGWEVWFGFYCRRYRKFMNLHFGMLLPCFFYVYFMLLRIFYASPRKRCDVSFMLLILFYASPEKHCYAAFMLLGLFYDYPKKCCYIPFMILGLFNALLLLCFSVYFILL